MESMQWCSYLDGPRRTRLNELIEAQILSLERLVERDAKPGLDSALLTHYKVETVTVKLHRQL